MIRAKHLQIFWLSHDMFKMEWNVSICNELSADGLVQRIVVDKMFWRLLRDLDHLVDDNCISMTIDHHSFLRRLQQCCRRSILSSAHCSFDNPICLESTILHKGTSQDLSNSVCQCKCLSTFPTTREISLHYFLSRGKFSFCIDSTELI